MDVKFCATRADETGMTVEGLRSGDRWPLSAAGLAADLERDGVVPRNLWLGYLSLGGTLTFPQLGDAFAGHRPVSPLDLYLLVRARNL